MDTLDLKCMVVTANLWGKDEDNPFGFARESLVVRSYSIAKPSSLSSSVRLRLFVPEGDIDGFMSLDTELMRCEIWGSVLALASNRCRGLLSLCISDAAKHLLLGNAGFIPHLIDGLMLDPEHPRKDTDEAIKTAVQRDFAECVQQISLFPAGRAALTADSAVVDVLDALVDKAWSEEAKDCARGALMQLTDRHHETVAEIDLDALHIMMSCECSSCIVCLIDFGIVVSKSLMMAVPCVLR